MASAIATTSRGLDPRGTNTFDIRRFGGRAGASAGCDAAVAAATARMDEIDPAGSRPFGLYFPGDPQSYIFNRTVYLTRSNLSLLGDGPDLSKLTVTSNCHHHLVFGSLNTRIAGYPLPSSHFVPLAGRLDSSITTGNGIRLGTDCVLAFWSTALDSPVPFGTLSGPPWTPFRRLTISLIIEGPAGGTIPVGPVCGMGGSQYFGGVPQPWRLYCEGQPNTFWFAFATSNNPTFTRGFAFSAGAATGPMRITLQLDLIACTFQAYVNKVQVAVTKGRGTGNPIYPGDPGFTPADNLSLAENMYAPFMFGAYGINTQTRAGVTTDLSLHGLCVTGSTSTAGTAGLLYRDDGVGQLQAAIDGASVTDAHLVRRAQSSSLIAQLDTANVSSSSALGGREVPLTLGNAVGSGGGRAVGLLSLTDRQINQVNWLGGLSIRGLGLTSASRYGDLLSLGGLLNVDVEDCSIQGGWNGIGCPRMGGTYPVLVANSTIQLARGADYFGFWHLASLKNVTFGGTLRHALQGVGSSFAVDHVILGQQSDAVNGNAYSVRLHSDGYGGVYSFKDVHIDNEGPPWPTAASLYYEPVKGDFKGSLTVDGWITGSTGPRAAVVHVNDTMATQPSHIDLRRIDAGGAATIVRIEGTKVRGDLELDANNLTATPVEPVGGVSARVVARSTDHPVPPGWHGWAAGMATIDVAGAPAGLWGGYRCVRSGRYGSPTVPRWQGRDLVDDGGGTALGAFSTVSESILVTVTGPGGTVAGDWGRYQEAVQHLLLDYWLRGVALAPAAGGVATLGISTRCHTIQDVYALNGSPPTMVAPVAVTGQFAPAANRGTANTAAVTFGLPAADYTAAGCQGLFLKDGAGRYVWFARLAAAVPVLAAGPALSVAIGGIVVSGGMASGTPTDWIGEYQGGFTTYALNAETDFWHRGVALPAVPGRYLGLSTGLANREGTYTEPTGNGYARIPLGTSDWAAPSEGRCSLAVNRFFPGAVGANWPQARSMFIADANSGGNTILNANLTVPRTARAGGAALGFAAGSLVVVK